MSSFAVVVNPQNTLTDQEPVFSDFLENVATHKCLAKPDHVLTGPCYAAAKLDSAASLHQGVITDPASGSWLLAVGSVVDTAEVQPSGNLQRLLTDYLAHGENVLERLDGHFALVIYDRQQEQLTVVSDPFGFISVYYGQQGDRIFVSTSALAVAQAVQAKPDPFGTRYFILYGNLVGETTLWADVKRVLPATALRLSRDGLEQHTYWRFQFDPAINKLSLKATVDCVISVLSQAMERALEREEKAWLSLTGGFDSRALAALADHYRIPFKSYTHGQPDARDVLIAALISRKLGWDHQYFPLPDNWGQQRAGWLARTLGQTDGHLEVFKTSRILREQAVKAEQYDVSLWGFGGETYRGYYWKQEFFTVGRTTTVNYDRLLDYRLLPAVNRPLIKDSASWVRRIREALKARLMAVGEQETGYLNTVKLDLIGKYLGHAWDGAHISSVLGLQRAIAPFDFKAGVACVISTNYRWRTHGRLFRLMLERLNPRLAQIETADGGPAIPMRLTNLPQFTPYWLGIAEKLAWGVTRKIAGRSLWSKKDAGPAGAAYPVGQWRRDTLSQLDEAFLAPATMYSAGLYELDTLQKFFAEAKLDDFRDEALLGRVVTVEMALSTVGTSFNETT